MPRTRKVVRRTTDKTRSPRQREYDRRLKAVRKFMSELFVAASNVHLELQDWEDTPDLKALGDRDAIQLKDDLREIREIFDEIEDCL